MGKGKKNKQAPSEQGSQQSGSKNQGNAGNQGKKNKNKNAGNSNEQNQPKPKNVPSEDKPSTSVSAVEKKMKDIEVGTKKGPATQPIQQQGPFAPPAQQSPAGQPTPQWPVRQQGPGASPIQQQSPAGQPIPQRAFRQQGPGASPVQQQSPAGQQAPQWPVWQQGPGASPIQQQSPGGQPIPQRAVRQQGPGASPIQQQSPAGQPTPQRAVRQQGPSASPIQQQRPSGQPDQQKQPSLQSIPQEKNPQAQAIKKAAVCSPAHSRTPDRGTHGKKFEVETNYLTLNIDKMPNVAYHYDVKIELYNEDPQKIKEPPKKFMRLAFIAYAKKIWPKYPFAYDGRASAYSVLKLPDDKLTANANALITAKVDEGRDVPFIVTLKSTSDAEIDLNSLRTYKTDRIFDKPMRALQCLEVVLGTPCHEKAVRAGRSFFSQPDQRMDLGDGYELWYGLYQAAMLCDMPLLNVDVSHKSFPSSTNLVQFYRNIRYRPEEQLKDFLRGLTVTYNPPKCFNTTPKHYKFNNVMLPSNRQNLNIEGKKMTVADYFSSKGYRLQNPDLPCLHVGSTTKNIYIPLELITVPPGQAILRKDNENQVRKMISYAATTTEERKRKIMSLLQRFQYYAHPVVESFGITVGRDFIKVEARLLARPRITYKRNTMDIERPGEWNMNRANFFKIGNLRDPYKWVIINYSDKINKVKLENKFVSMIKSTSRQLGMNLADCSYITDLSNPSNFKPVEVHEKMKALKKDKVDLVFVILPIGRSEQYAIIKQIAELSCGIVTQCIKSDTIYKETRQRTFEINSMTTNNILLKVNAKLNGINHIIAEESKIALQRTAKIMFVGADVSHPSPLQKDIPSIVGVVASHDANGTQYNMQYRLQNPKQEEIEDMKEIFQHHLLMYKQNMKYFPDTVIYYRDGVSDGQFQIIETVELNAMRTACKMLGCSPKFTCIIVVKRHHTRFFPKGEFAEGKFLNVMAGTVVDKTIIHPGEEQFFMVSHKSIQGTAKPTRYNVIIDDSKIPINDLQTLTYNLCHLFPRCNRSVSYPAPAYLSHLVGLRGRAYIHGSRIKLDKLKDENTKHRVCDAMKLNPMHFV